MSHTKWKQLQKKLLRRRTDEDVITYCRGYILALEDVLKDMDEIAPVDDFGVEQLRYKVTESLASGERTLKSFEQLLTEDATRT